MQLELVDICRTLHPTTPDSIILFSSVQRTFIEINHNQAYKIDQKMFRRIHVVQRRGDTKNERGDIIAYSINIMRIIWNYDYNVMLIPCFASMKRTNSLKNHKAHARRNQ